MSHNEFINDVQTLGFPIVLVAAMAWAIWQILKWIRPKIDALLETHISFVKRVEAAVDSLQQTLERIGSSLSILPTIHRDIEGIKKHVGLKDPGEE